MEGRKSERSRRSRKTKKKDKTAKFSERDRIENEVHQLLKTDTRQLVRSEAKKLFDEEEQNCVTDRTPETPYNSEKEVRETEDLAQNHELAHKDLMAALERVENNSNVDDNLDKTPPSYDPVDSPIEDLQTAIPLIPYPPPPSDCPLPPSHYFSLRTVCPPLHVMAAKSSDSKQSLVSKTGDHRAFSYSSSLGGTTSSTTTSASSTSLLSATGSMAPPSSQTGSVVHSLSNLSIESATGLSIPSAASSTSNVSLNSETGSNVSGYWPADDKKNTSTGDSEKISKGPTPRTPGVSTSESSLESKTFSPMATNSSDSSDLISKTFTPMVTTMSTKSTQPSKTMATSSDSSALLSQTMSPLKEETMKETTPKITEPATSSTSDISHISFTGASRSAKSESPTDDGHTSSFRSPLNDVQSRKDINASSQTPVRELAKDFSRRSNLQILDSSLYQPSGKYDANGDFSPADQTLDDVPEIPTEKSPPLRTATESMSSTSLAINSDVVPDRIYGDDEDLEIGAKSDKMFVGRMTLKKNKKNEAMLEFEDKAAIEASSKPIVPRKLKVTNVFGGADRKYVPPERKKAEDRKTTVVPPPAATPARTDDSHAHLESLTTDQRLAPSPPLSVTKKSEREGTVLQSMTAVPPSSATTSTVPSLTNISLLKTVSLPPSTARDPTRSPAVSPVTPPRKGREKGRKSKEKTETKNPRERIVYREAKVEPTIGTPNRKWRKPVEKKADTVDRSADRSEKERERTTKYDKKKKSVKRAGRDRSKHTDGQRFYQQLAYASYVTNGLNVARYNYDERAEKATIPMP